MKNSSKVIILFSMLSAIVVAGNRNVVVRPPQTPTQVSTEVRLSEHPTAPGSDSLIIIPGAGVTSVDITVRDLEGNAESHERVSVTNAGGEIPTAAQQVGDDKMIEVSDDNGFYGIY